MAGRDRLQALAAQAASNHGLDPQFFQALINQESGWDPSAVSHAGAIGLGQLMPSTAQALGVDPRNPAQNLDGSARYLKQQMDRFGDPAKALAAYNAGPAAVEHFGGVPPFPQTQAYVQKILGAMATGRGALGPISWGAPATNALPTTATAEGATISWGQPASAPAQRQPVRITELQGKTKADIGDLQPGMKSALSGAADALAKQGIDIGPLITSGYRSSAEQARLYANRANNPNPVAPPGHSAHESGNAIDIAVHHLPASLQQTVLSTLNQFGLYRPVASDPVHFTLRGGTGRAATGSAQPISWAAQG